LAGWVFEPPRSWRAQWVSPTADPGTAGRRPAYRLRGSFSIDGPVRRATLFATAHGIYEAELNGVRVGDEELTPGYTEYQHHTQVQSYDVTGLLRPGENLLDALLADGWYRGQVGVGRAHDQWGTETAFLAQLELEHEDGTRTVVGTDGTWRWTTSHISVADLIEGQHEDRRLLGSGGWSPVRVADHGFETLVGSPSPPVRAVEALRPVSVTELGKGVHVFDLGQNINGRVRLADLGPAGTELVLTHGEALGPDGDVSTDHLAPDMPFLPEPLPAGQPGATRSCWCRGSSIRSTATRRCCATRGRTSCAGSTGPSGWHPRSATPTGTRSTASRARTTATSGTPGSTGASGWSPART
jgi:alpha-L-rhamnosidase